MNLQERYTSKACDVQNKAACDCTIVPLIACDSNFFGTTLIVHFPIRTGTYRSGFNYYSRGYTGHLLMNFKGTRCLGSVELVFEKRSVTVCYKMHMVRKML